MGDGCFELIDKSWLRPDTHVGTYDERWLDNMQESHTRLELLRQGHGIVQCLLGIGAKVNRNEHMVDSHGEALSRSGLLESSSNTSSPILMPRQAQ
jgi:hypothetical protein